MAGAAAAIAALTMAYPRSEFPQGSVELYVRMLADLDEREVAQAIERLIKRSTFLPSIAEIRLEVSEARLGLPTAEEAWEIATRGRVADAPEELRIALESAGGRWSLIHSESPEIIRAQFTKDYAARRNRAVMVAAGAIAESNVVELLPHREQRMIETAKTLPESTRISPRPVMLRMMRRRAGHELQSPTEQERSDAIRVLNAGPQALPDLGGDTDPLFEEAQRILDEATAAA